MSPNRGPFYGDRIAGAGKSASYHLDWLRWQSSVPLDKRSTTGGSPSSQKRTILATCLSLSKGAVLQHFIPRVTMLSAISPQRAAETVDIILMQRAVETRMREEQADSPPPAEPARRCRVR